MRVKEVFTKKLLVEGNDDQHVIWALCNKFLIEQNFDVIDCEGIDNLISQIPVRAKQSGITTIGIVVDADSDLIFRWRVLAQILTSMNYIVPDIIPENGLIISNSTIKIGIWLMPNNSLNGMIEDFIKFLIPEHDQLLDIANQSLNQIETENLNNYNVIHRAKALIHTWLAWQEDPGTPMESSITKRYLNTDTKTCTTLMDWITNLFN